MIWVNATYIPITAFSLKPSNTTSTGGRTLLIPTPYAIRMALLKAMIVAHGVETTIDQFENVRNLSIHVRVPSFVCVNRLIQLLFRTFDSEQLLWTRAPVTREYCFYEGHLNLTFGNITEHFAFEQLIPLLTSINYFGRKGGFFQLDGCEKSQLPPTPEDGFVDLCQPVHLDDLRYGILQWMDDMHPDTHFRDVNTHQSDRSSDRGRRSYMIRLPYQLVEHGKNYVRYRRLDLKT